MFEILSYKFRNFGIFYFSIDFLNDVFFLNQCKLIKFNQAIRYSDYIVHNDSFFRDIINSSIIYYFKFGFGAMVDFRSISCAFRAKQFDLLFWQRYIVELEVCKNIIFFADVIVSSIVFKNISLNTIS